ncbi:MAG: hypothetical protein AAGF23_27690, partial [Acidobacteriota bacterium]
YDDGTSRLDVPGGDALPRGRYGLFVCSASVADLDGNPLDGDDAGGGDDFRIEFLVSDTVLLNNPNFDVQLAPWSSVDFAWSPEDFEGAPTSGSAEVITPEADRGLAHPCVSTAGETGLGGLLAGRIFDPDPGAPAVSLDVTFYDGADCAGADLGTVSVASIVGDTADAWRSGFGWIEVPETAVSAAPVLRFSPSGSSPGEVLLDRVVLAPMLFGSGFESGDLSEWSSVIGAAEP